MNSLAALILAPLATLLPFPVAGDRVPAPTDGRVMAEGEVRADDALAQSPALPWPLRILRSARSERPANQMRIEQRVIIRISPGTATTREQLMAALPRKPIRQTYQEEKVKGCVPIATIVGAQPGPDNRLLLFMSDRRVLTVGLDRTCNARDFYSGFYVERNEDGRLCSGRDHLQSRAGASCAVERLNRLVAVKD